MCWKYWLTTIWVCEICNNPVAPLDEPTRDLLYCFIDGDPENDIVQIADTRQCEYHYAAHQVDDGFAVGPEETTTVQVSGQHCHSLDCQTRDADFTRFWNLRWAEQERRVQQPPDLIHEEIWLDGQARDAGYQDGFNELDFHARNKYPGMWERDRHLAMKILLRERHLNADFQRVQNFPTLLQLGPRIREEVDRRANVTTAWMEQL